MRTKLLSLQLKSWLLTLLMLVGAGSTWAATYKLVQVNSVESGGLYVFEQENLVMGNSISSNALLTASSYSTSGLNGTEAYVWALESATGGYYMKNVSINKYLDNTSGKTNVSVVDRAPSSAVWEFILEDDNTFLIRNIKNSNRFLGLASLADSNRAYKAYASTTQNEKQYPHAITVYQLVAESVPVESVSLSEAPALLEVGEGFQLTATVLPEDATDKSVTWASSDENVAMVEDGYVLATGAGTATITVTTNDGGMTATCEITVSEGNVPVIVLSDALLDFGNVEVGGTQSLTLTVTPAHLTADLTIDVDNAKYTVSPATIAQTATAEQTITVTAAPTALSDDMTGLLTIRGGGLAENRTVDLTATVVAKSPNLLVEEAFEMEVTTKKSLNDLYLTDSDGEVSITINDETIAKVEDGMLKAIKPGVVILTVKVEATAVHTEASATITVTVVTKPAVQPAGSNLGSYYALVTDASELADGDKVLIVNNDKGKAMSTTQNSNNRGEVEVTILGSRINELPENLQEITLEKYNADWCFNVGDGYLYAASSSANHLKTQGTKNNNAKAKIEITDAGIAAITFQGTYTHNKLRYNSASKLFACYSSGQDDVSLYRSTPENSYNVHIGTTGWRTLVSAKDVSVPAGYKAYIVTTNDGVTAYLASVKKIKNNTPVLLQGPADSDCTLTLINEEVDYPSENLLQISTETTGNGVYVLANKSKGVGFYLWTGGALGAGRVYLTLPVDGDVHEFISFDMDDETAIEAVAAQRTATGVYDLQGRRVVKPAAGLYIVNGKKMFIK